MRIKMKVKVLVLAMMVTLLSSNCTYSLSKNGESKPNYTLASIKSPQGLTRCIEIKMRSTLPTTVFIVDRQQRSNNSYCVVIINKPNVVDILIKPTDNNGSIVEFRKRGFFGYYQPLIQDVIERCAK